jgi:hypothetical protein
MIDGAPDDRLFKSAIGGIIHRVKVSVTNGHAGKVRAFGGMVSLLWNDNLAAAKRLEELWNEIIDIHSISLMYTYCVGNSVQEALPQSLIDCHSERIG